MFLGLPDPDPDLLVKGYGSGSFPFLRNVLSGLKYCNACKIKFLTQNFSKKFNIFD